LLLSYSDLLSGPAFHFLNFLIGVCATSAGITWPTTTLLIEIIFFNPNNGFFA
jgi:hypothetical protein